TLPVPGSTMDREVIAYVVVDDLATLVWLANLAALELHIPQWTVSSRAKPRGSDLLVFDLDPGPRSTMVECTRVAMMLGDLLADDGPQAAPKTSGSKGMQLYAPIKPIDGDETSMHATSLAAALAQAPPRR